jgi:ribosomal protein S18 acetylase RimI-like enzyme
MTCLTTSRVVKQVQCQYMSGGSIMIDSLFSTITALITAIIALISFLYTSHRQRKIEKSSMYQQLELATIDLMKWESENTKTKIKIRKGSQDISEEDNEFINTRFFYTLNLFELCISSAKRRTLPKRVFGSWLPWIHEFTHEAAFGKIWSKNKIHYVPECREVIDYAIGNSEYDFIKKICTLKNFFILRKYNLNIKDWKRNDFDEKKQYNKDVKNGNITVDIQKGNIENIEKYLSIFDESKHDSYISHGEVFYGRATYDLKWAENIIMQMKQEFIDYLKNNEEYTVFEILSSDELMGFAIIELNKKTKAAILSDIMIKRGCQGEGIGTKALRKIENHLKNENIGIILLESGINNRRAHKFFKKTGYTAISVEYSKVLS